MLIEDTSIIILQCVYGGMKYFDRIKPIIAGHFDWSKMDK
jgi:hypothetical protein